MIERPKALHHPRGISKAANTRLRGDITMTRAALDGPDIWQDEAVMNCIFASNRLKRAVEDANIKSLGFIACDLEGA